jgi:hypothetical protein
MPASFESIFSYQGIPRLGYFWANPNHAAAVLVALIGIFWVLRLWVAPRGWRIVIYASIAGAELFWSLLIGWTCSRGALVAWAVSLVVFGLLKIKSLSLRTREGAIFWAVSLVCLTVALLATGTGERFLEIADGDRSALNRLGIWSDALKLIYAAPLTGWGAGQSGNALVHWFAPLESTKEYAAIVGTFLHVGAEFGLPALTLVFAVLGVTLLVGVDAERKVAGWKNGVLLASLVGLVGFLTAGLFSTLWVNIRTSGVVPLFVALIWLAAWRGKTINARKATAGLAVALALSLVLYAGAWSLSLRGDYMIRKTSDGVAIMKPSAAKSAGDAVFLLDSLVLGTFYGRPVRRIAEGVDHWQTIYVYTGQPSWAEHAGAELFIFGARLTGVSKEILAKATVVAPVTAYSRERYGVPASVLLTEYDEFGHASSWLFGLSSNRENVRVIAETGQDCSSQVPALIKLFQGKAN